MYIVVNTTSSILNISDLNISIPPNQSRDLDKMSLNKSPDKSNDLKIAINNHYLKVVKRNKISNKEIKINNSKKIIKKEVIDEKKLAKLFSEEIRKVKEEERKNSSEEMIKTLATMMGEFLKNNSIQNNNIKKNIEENSNEESIDIKELSKIHRKAMRKISQDTENKIDYEQETTKDNSFNDRANELEGLL